MNGCKDASCNSSGKGRIVLVLEVGKVENTFLFQVEFESKWQRI